jgi:PhzF family phenazine biosynthesis protein
MTTNQPGGDAAGPPETVRVFHVDAFTDRPFAGNPAAVCLLDRPAPVDWMQAVAAEHDLPATAFVHPAGDDGWGLRWFSAQRELELCGHGTLTSAHVLLSEFERDGDLLRFSTAAGPLTATRRDGGLIELNLPVQRPEPIDPPAGLAEALFPGRPDAAMTVFRGPMDLLAVLAHEDDVRACRPDHPRLAELPARVVIVTAPGRNGVDMVSRVFAPSVGVDEDPVTGSAHCLLGPYWADRLGRSALRAHQASARGGDLTVEVRGDRVLLGGRAVTVSSGVLTGEAGPRASSPGDRA